MGRAAALVAKPGTVGPSSRSFFEAECLFKYWNQFDAACRIPGTEALLGHIESDGHGRRESRSASERTRGGGDGHGIHARRGSRILQAAVAVVAAARAQPQSAESKHHQTEHSQVARPGTWFRSWLRS